MITYAVTILTSCIFSFFSSLFLKKKKETNKKRYMIFCILFCILTVIPILLVSALRQAEGTDYYHRFYDIFEGIKNGSTLKDNYYNYSYYYLNKFILLFTTDVRVIFIVTSFIFVLPLYFAVLKMSRNWPISVFMIMFGLMLFQSFSNIRQALAVSFSVLAFAYSCEKKYHWTIILAAIAFGFQQTALMVMPLYFVSGIRWLDEHGWIIALVIVASTPLLYYAVQFMGLKLYPGRTLFTTDGEDDPIYPSMIAHGALWLFSMWNYRKLVRMNKYNMGLILVQSLCLVMSLESLETRHMELALRSVFMFNFASIFLIPSILDAYHDKFNGICVTIILLCIFFILTIYVLGYKDWFEVLPYKTIWGFVDPVGYVKRL